ncbi:glycine/D-amino acid oxidase-like deaminating enzyme [Rhizobium azooxidifex]|uniref:Glycine/D-amino acid oxidase-like deaminating enzyme n=1 Tax=Mycoplana azooxidifex TaxID=1636188 RepID=A0A7W6DD14_9HYPH|nr:FAD-binding oxidoreductase [Mycoplana azooxidifex]MBB3978420.1 glycine/D-amino acid oxidase-like deaminating enzyme [Mycoplana azooxidifex]
MHRSEDASPTTLYWQSSGPSAAYPPLDGGIDVEAAIVGGGLTGLSAALHVAEAGGSVAVLEAAQPGWGASGRNGGQLNPGLKFDPDAIEAMFGAERGRQLVRLAWGGPEFTRSLIRRLGIDCDVRQNGTLRAAPHRKAADALQKTVERWQQYGMPVEWMDGDAIAAATGTGRYRGAMFDPGGGDLNPLKFVRGLAAAAQEKGARIFGDSKVPSLHRQNGGWVLKTARGTVKARRVLIATNGYSDDLVPKLRRSVIPVFSAIVATDPLPDALAAALLPSRSVLYESGNITVYYRLDADNRLLIGGRGPMRPVRSADVLPNLTRYAEVLWPALAGTRWTHARNGRVAMTKDHLPHLHQPQEGLFACLGYNGRGVALSTSLGPALAQVLRGGPVDACPLPVTPIRPFAFHPFWPIGAKVAIWHGRLKDMLP